MMLEDLAERWSGTKDDRPHAGLATAICLLAICAAVSVLGVPHLRYFGHDVFIALDGGWRVLSGQRPAVDFLATIGPAWYLLYAGGLALAGKAATGLGWANGLAALCMAVWSFVLLRRRMAPGPFFIACVSLLLLATAPFPLGYPPWHSGFAMNYNRQGFAWLGIVLLECFLPLPMDIADGSGFWGGFSTGLACAILIFLKISYGLVAVAVGGFSVLLRPRERTRVLGILGGALFFSVPMLAYLRFDLGALIRENRLLASVRGSELSLKNIFRRLLTDRNELAPTLLVGLFTAFLPGIQVRRRMLLAFACLIAAASGTLLIIGNAQPSGLPLIAIAALLLANEITLAIRAGRTSPALGAPLLCFALIAIVMPTVLDAAGLSFALADKVLHRNAGTRLTSAPHMSALAFFEDDIDPTELNENGGRVVRLTEEGMALVRRFALPGESVRGLAGTNPFSYALFSRPSNGGAVSITDRKVSETVVPPIAILIGDVDLLLAPKFLVSSQPTLSIIFRRYPHLLGEDYLRVSESENWTLYRKQAAR